MPGAITNLFGRPLAGALFGGVVCVLCTNGVPPRGFGQGAVSAALTISGAWVPAGAMRWFCRRVRFSDGDAADFAGRGIEVAGWLLLGFAARWSRRPLWDHAAADTATWGAGDFLVAVLIGWQVLRWFVRNLRLKSGHPLKFGGGYWRLAGWSLLNRLLLFTIVGWAWSLAATYRWWARNMRGKGVQLRFHGEGGELLRRALATALLSVPLVTLPWDWLWYARWVVSMTTMEIAPATSPGRAAADGSVLPAAVLQPES